ncbi:Ribosomal protein S18 acetylase RimI [Nakamurella panacisegetis]|uniref:Ribosomal protein S18 acetylase RimI n=1 Tax=Nakamurella panacisegetis TaxID=1090615 RepID=A0A1H0MNI5_9ACTN|nr:GNAT family N-acetyltransferase [Nakamurella panacisegetis]SDO81836.1 Ribosomal protein S18 acetylase RimI [Nakamurella panacisegetis]
MDDPVVVRRATMSDVDGLVASGVSLFREDCIVHDRLRNPEWAAVNAADYETGNLADPDLLVLVAVHGRAVVGHLTGGFDAEPATWLAPTVDLISLNVMAEWRGQSIGTRLMGEFKAWARGRGAVRCRVTAYSANQGAIRFYRRHGFASLQTTLAADL